MTKAATRSGVFNFAVDAGLLFELGERLVTRPSIALSELIKNAYDADATRATVLIENVRAEEDDKSEHSTKDTKHPTGSILIEDNGSGMTFEDVRDHWMRIATDDKIRNPISPLYGRLRTGAKGIGRFAARRLADTLSLVSVAGRDDGTKEEVSVKFEWGKAFRRGQDLSSVEVNYERRSVDKDTPTGVTLLLEEIRDRWTEEDIAELRRDLVTLMDPFPSDKILRTKEIDGFQADPGFSATLQAGEFPEQEGELREHFFKAAWGELTGEVDSEGRAHYKFKTQKSSDVSEYVEDQAHFQDIVGTDFKIYFFVYASRHFRDVDFGYQEAIKYGREFGGVRIYLNGFRVYGYGEKGEDWLRLNELRAERERTPDDLTPFLRQEYRKLRREFVQPFLSLPGNNQLFGAVFLTQSQQASVNGDEKGTKIELNIARDRLVENDAFNQLRLLLKTGIYWMTVEYARFRWKEEVREPFPEINRPIEPVTPQVEDALRFIEHQVQTSPKLGPEQKSEISRAITNIRQVTRQYDQARKEYDKKRITEISMLRVLASLGTTIAFLNHQLRAVENNLAEIAALFKIYAKDVSPQIRDAYLENVRDLWQWHQLIKTQVDQLNFLLGLKARSELKPHNLHKVVNDVARPLEGYAQDFGINFDNKVPNNLMSPPMYLAEIHAILINILTNALKAVRYQPERKISVQGGYRGRQVFVQMIDTGKGLDIPRESAFEPFTTTSAPDPVLGEGTGLGLYVVRAIVQSYNGTVHFVNAPNGWKTCVEITLPRR